MLPSNELTGGQTNEIPPGKPDDVRKLFRDARVVVVTPRRDFMSSTTDKVKGTTNEAVGKAKQGLGKATGSGRLEGEGTIQEAKGKGQKFVGNAKDAVNRAAGAARK
jgi:uncharacterized protein YjbJ (UPF0337 family)